MNRSKSLSFLAGTLAASYLAFGTAAYAQEPNPTSVPAPSGAAITQSGDIFFYKVKVVQRDIDAVNYLHRSGSTRLDFEGTSLLPNARGKAEVKSERGKITVDADFRGLTPANGFGPEFLTYVLWAISPDGRPVNLGEVLPAGTKNNLSVTVPIQAFGLVVTAEPIPLINSSHVRGQLPQTSVQTAIVSISELEDVVATCLHERSGKVFLDITTPETDGGYAPLAALGRGHRAHVEPRNPLLDSGFDDGAFPLAPSGTD